MGQATAGSSESSSSSTTSSTSSPTSVGSKTPSQSSSTITNPSTSPETTQTRFSYSHTVSSIKTSKTSLVPRTRATRRRYFPREDTIGSESKKFADNGSNISPDHQENETSKKGKSENGVASHLHPSTERTSSSASPITLTVYSDFEETPLPSDIKSELRDKIQHIDSNEKRVTYSVKLHAQTKPTKGTSTQRYDIYVDLPGGRTVENKDVELSLTPAVMKPSSTTTPMEQMDIETSLRFTEKTLPIDNIGTTLYCF